MTGEEFGKYRIEERLASGGMAELFVGFLQGAKGFERKVAIKRILPHLAADEAFQTMFWDEATLAANLSHPNVVQVLDFGEEAGQLFMALEFVDGIDLKSLGRKLLHADASLSAAQLALVVEGIAAGLHHVHTATSQTNEPLNIVHRDISPHNVMLSRDGHVKVMDFGVAHAEVRSSKTATGVLKGKLAYMAPEQANDGRLDHRVDQFALGLLIWELAVGEPAYQGPNDAVLLRKVLTRDLEPLETYRPDLPSDFTSLVMKMLELEPDNRFRDMDAVYRSTIQCRFALGEAGATAHLGEVVAQAIDSGERRSHPAPVSGVAAHGMSNNTRTIDEAEQESTIAATAMHVPDHVGESMVPTAMTTIEGAEAQEAPTRVSTNPEAPPRSNKPLSGLGLMVPVGALALAVVVWGLDWNASNQPVRVKLTPATAPLVETKSAPTDGEAPTSAKGEVPHSFERSQDDGGAEITKKDAARPEVAPSPQRSLPDKESKASNPKLRQKKSNPASDRTPKRSPSQKAKVRSSDTGTLQLRVSEGWYHVLFGSRRLGTTPLGGVSLPVGEHRLILENPVTGDRRVINVSIKKGEVTKMSVGAPR